MEKECNCVPNDTSGKLCNCCIFNSLTEIENQRKEICESLGNNPEVLDKFFKYCEKYKHHTMEQLRELEASGKLFD
jgi:hypothetical protein